MSNKFCDNCNNLFYLYSNEKNELYYGSKVCGNKELYEPSIDKFIYNSSKIKKDTIINNNDNLINDITLPYLSKNSVIKCINPDCNDNSKPITFIKYDDIDMKYIYICTGCSQKWSN